MTKLASEKASDLEDMTRWRVSAIREKFEGIINAIDAPEKNEESDGLLCLACRHMKGNVMAVVHLSNFVERGNPGMVARVTTRPCRVCEKDVMSGNTVVDKLCESCASKTGCCRSCGAEREAVKDEIMIGVNRISGKMK